MHLKIKATGELPVSNPDNKAGKLDAKRYSEEVEPGNRDISNEEHGESENFWTNQDSSRI